MFLKSTSAFGAGPGGKRMSGWETGVGAALILGVGGLAGLLPAWRRRRALGELVRGIRRLDEGRPPWPVQGEFLGRLGQLFRVFNEAAPRLEARLERLERDRRLLRTVLQGMTEGVIAIDGRGRLIFANEAADRLFGLGPEAVGRRVVEVIRSPRVQEAIDSTVGGDSVYQGEIEVASPPSRNRGGPLFLDIHGTPLSGGTQTGAVLVFHDVTDLRRLERMRQDFVANASHELKTPLSSIKAYTETLLDGALLDEAVNLRFLRRIDEQADRLGRLIQDLLSLARLESGRDVFEHAPLAIREAVGRCVEAHRTRAESKGLSYRLVWNGGEDDAQVLADEEAIRQVLDNLIDNAVKYTPEGGSVEVRCGLEGGSVVIEVADTGIGIPRDDLPRVFERFYRVDKARSRELGGTGLGLSIVKHLVQSLNGMVDVESRINGGSVFRVVLPRLQASAHGGAEEAVSTS